MIDKVFDKPIEKSFEFDESVASVFTCSHPSSVGMHI